MMNEERGNESRVFASELLSQGTMASNYTKKEIEIDGGWCVVEVDGMNGGLDYVKMQK